MDDNIRVISTTEELKIFNDPYRLKIIRVYQKSEEPLTVKGCADLMGEVPAKVHYHIKKLLKIHILELDHIEVINGINAKYYKMPQKGFTISIKKDDPTAMYQNLTQVHNMVERIFNDFREEFMKSSSYAIENDLQEDSEVGIISSDQLYLSSDEFKQLSEYIKNLYETHKEEREDRKKYTLITGLSILRDK